MDKYYSDLTTAALQKALENLKNAREYALDADAPEWMLINLKKISSGISNRINDILVLREKK